jgi:hypothetical protein
MPSRRRSRRSPQLISHNSMSRRARQIKRPPNLRLIRRYKKVDPETNGKQPNFGATGRIVKPARNPGRPFGYGPHEVVVKGPVKQPAEINFIPNPIPDTGPVTLGSIAAGSPLLGAIRDTSTFGLLIPPTPPPSLPLSITPPGSFSALPPLQSSIPSLTSAILIETNDLSSPSSASLPKSPNANPQTAASKSHSVNLAVIILLAVGSALLLLGSCILIKICTRTRRKGLPKPSLPIFEDADPEADFFETKESPIFGGKERFSPMPEPDSGDPAWSWIQYPHAGLSQPVASVQRNSNGGPHMGSYPIQPGHINADAPNESPLVVPTTSPHNLRRQSMGAASIYSPRSCANIAQAITHDRLATANGDELLTQSRTRTSPNRRSQLVRDEKQRHRESSASTVGLAYDGASPSFIEYTPVDTPVIGHREGRERIKSSYFATGSYPAVSNMHGTAYSIATATRVNLGQRNSFSKDKFTLRNSNTKWQRDTQALTYALGLATPETNYLTQSPQPTLYPEDSMSVIGIKQQRNLSDRNPPESVPDIPVIIPDDEPPQNSGLMNMDFRVSQMSLSELTMEDDGRLSPGEASEPDHATDRPMPRTQSSSNTGLRGSLHSAGMPPRVPSPPPLPSLSQMALQQHNPEAYANYRSPTYSLYGLYESPDRRSIIR